MPTGWNMLGTLMASALSYVYWHWFCLHCWPIVRYHHPIADCTVIPAWSLQWVDLLRLNHRRCGRSGYWTVSPNSDRFLRWWTSPIFYWTCLSYYCYHYQWSVKVWVASHHRCFHSVIRSCFYRMFYICICFLWLFDLLWLVCLL